MAIGKAQKRVTLSPRPVGLPLGKVFKWYDLDDPPSGRAALTPEERSAASKKAWESRERAKAEATGATGAAPDKPSYPADQPIDSATGRPIPIKVASIEDAVVKVLNGNVVELPDVQSVSTLVDKLAAIANDAKALGKDAPVYDLCRVTVPNTNIFCAENVRTKEFPEGIPRVSMPQMSGYPVPGSAAAKLPVDKKGNVDATKAFIDHMRSVGIPVSEIEEVSAAMLKASQRELVGANVAGMITDPTFDPARDPIFISDPDNYVIDGHHRWAAVVGRDAADGRLGDSKMKVIRVKAPITEVLAFARHFAKTFGIQPQKAGAAGIRKAP